MNTTYRPRPLPLCCASTVPPKPFHAEEATIHTGQYSNYGNSRKIRNSAAVVKAKMQILYACENYVYIMRRTDLLI